MKNGLEKEVRDKMECYLRSAGVSLDWGYGEDKQSVSQGV